MAIIIQRIPSGDIIPGQQVTFTVTSGATEFSIYKWFLVSGSTTTLVSTDSTCTLTFNDYGGVSVYVELLNYDNYWLDGHFYGGIFDGCFAGGTFHYGRLNGNDYNKTNIKNKIFIEKSN